MAQKLSKIWTFGKALYHLTFRLKEYTDKIISPTGWMEIINLKLPQAQAILGLKNSAEYKEPIVITPAADAAGGWWTTGSGVTYNSTTKNLYVPTAIFSTMFSVDFINFLTTNPLGARVFLAPDLSSTGIYELYVERVVDANNVILDRTISLLTAEIGGMKLPGNSDTVNIGAYSIYKNIREITLIESNTEGECIEKPKEAYLNITKPPIGTYHSHWLKKIIWCRDGELINLAKGNLSSYGTLTMWIFRIPYPVDEAYPDEPLDARDEDMNIIFDMCLLTGLETLKVPIPEDLKSTENQINKLVEANNAQKAMLLSGKE